MNTDKIHKDHCIRIRLQGVGAYILANLLLLPLYFHVLIGIWINMAPSGTYDSLEPCLGVRCDGPNYLATAAFSMILLLGFSAAAYTGAKIGKFRNFRRIFAIFMIPPLAICVSIILIIL